MTNYMTLVGHAVRAETNSNTVWFKVNVHLVCVLALSAYQRWSFKSPL